MSDDPAAAVAILRARAPQESILLIRRAENPQDPWSGHWSFPGGRRDPADADLLDTALRELAEEVGIQLRRDDLSETLPIAHAGRRVSNLMRVQPFTFELPQILPVALNLDEAAEAVWVPATSILDTALHSKTAIPGLPDDVLFPALLLHGTPLWGFTYRVLCGWLGIPLEDSPGPLRA